MVRIEDERREPTTARFDLPAGDRFSSPIPRLAAGAMPRRPRPSQLLPWSDPYIARLVHNLQDEVRRERGAACRVTTETAELEPPCPGQDFEFDWDGDEPRWSLQDGVE
ncbi:MAG: hypothetical protein CMJ58_15930 [Planctomycetaceae bacterium]|nr:hypothetical protein [Planctomycetaceae bacterium]